MVKSEKERTGSSLQPWLIKCVCHCCWVREAKKKARQSHCICLVLFFFVCFFPTFCYRFYSSFLRINLPSTYIYINILAQCLTWGHQSQLTKPSHSQNRLYIACSFIAFLSDLFKSQPEWNIKDGQSTTKMQILMFKCNILNYKKIGTLAWSEQFNWIA